MRSPWIVMAGLATLASSIGVGHEGGLTTRDQALAWLGAFVLPIACGAFGVWARRASLWSIPSGVVCFALLALQRLPPRPPLVGWSHVLAALSMALFLAALRESWAPLRAWTAPPPKGDQDA